MFSLSFTNKDSRNPDYPDETKDIVVGPYVTLEYRVQKGAPSDPSIVSLSCVTKDGSKDFFILDNADFGWLVPVAYHRGRVRRAGFIVQDAK
jgi:hypothetical protein